MALAEPSFRKAIAIVEERAFESPTEPQLLELLASHRVNVGAWKAQDGLEDQAAQERTARLMDAFDAADAGRRPRPCRPRITTPTGPRRPTDRSPG